jgi:flagellar export protein FliJ
VTSLRGHQFYWGWLHRKILESTVELAARKTRLEVERGKLSEASKRLKVIENLRDRQLARYQAAVAREERAASDEAAMQTYMQQGRLGREVRV